MGKILVSSLLSSNEFMKIWSLLENINYLQENFPNSRGYKWLMQEFSGIETTYLDLGWQHLRFGEIEKNFKYSLKVIEKTLNASLRNIL